MRGNPRTTSLLIFWQSSDLAFHSEMSQVGDHLGKCISTSTCFFSWKGEGNGGNSSKGHPSWTGFGSRDAVEEATDSKGQVRYWGSAQLSHYARCISLAPRHHYVINFFKG